MVRPYTPSLFSCYEFVGYSGQRHAQPVNNAQSERRRRVQPHPRRRRSLQKEQSRLHKRNRLLLIPYNPLRPTQRRQSLRPPPPKLPLFDADGGL